MGRRRQVLTMVAAIIALACWLCACGGDSTDGGVPRSGPVELPDVLLVSIDTLRADRLGCYGHERARTPTIDALAAEGALFESAYTTAPITLPAHASMLSGLTPLRHGVRDNDSFRLPETVETVAEALRERGYQTGAFIGGLPLEHTRGLNRGFDLYDDAMPTRSLGAMEQATRAERVAEEVFEAASRWKESLDDTRPAFFFVHLYDPHSPYVRSMPGSTTLEYDGEVAYVDVSLGRFLSSLEADSRSRSLLTIVTADHGEGLGEHDEDTHGVFAYDSTLRIPWIVHWPGYIEPSRVSGSVAIIDIAPTLVDLLGMPALEAPDGPVDGRSRATELRTSEPAEQGELYFESLFGQLRFGWAPLRGLRDGSWKYIELPRGELYDLADDPGETENLVHARPEIAERMAARLATMGTGAHATAEIDPETRRRLESLGYVSAPPVDPADPASSPDPKDEIRAYEDFQRAHALALKGRIDDTLTLMAGLESSLSRSPYFYVEWGNFAAAARQWPLAIRCYEKCVALDPSNEDALLNLAVAFAESERFEDARAQLDALLGVNPDHVKALLFAGVIAHNRFRDSAAAVRYWERFLALAPDHAEAGKIRKAVEALSAQR